MIEELTSPDPNRTCSLSTSAARTRGPRCSCTVYLHDTAAAAPLARHLARPHWGICLFFSISHSLLCRECRQEQQQQQLLITASVQEREKVTAQQRANLQKCQQAPAESSRRSHGDETVNAPLWIEPTLEASLEDAVCRRCPMKICSC